MHWRLLWLGCLLAFAVYVGSTARWVIGQPPAVPVSRPRERPADEVPPLSNHLSLAAAYLEKGDERRACEHLGAFLRVQPEHRNARYYYAELLLKLGQPSEARTHFEHAIAYAQDETPRDLKHLVHCHGRLMEIGERLEDEFALHLHRGIGMYLLAQQQAGLHLEEGPGIEALLCKAAAELSMARTLRPRAARPSWYLYSVWRQLAQHQQARRWLSAAHEAAPFSYLTPAEQRAVELACRTEPVRTR
jgi:tetratricopeptide (TPR) repeat protein